MRSHEDYKAIFEGVESAILRLGSSQMPVDQIRSQMHQRYKDKANDRILEHKGSFLTQWLECLLISGIEACDGQIWERTSRSKDQEDGS